MMDFQLERLRQKLREKTLEYARKLNQDTPDIGLGHLAVLAVLSVPAFFYTRYFAAFGLMVVTLLASLIVNSYNLNRMGIELATFSTVTMGFVFPAEISAILGFIYISLQIFSGSTPGIYMLWVIPSMTVAGYLIGNFEYLGVVQAGIYASIALQSFFILMTLLTSRSRLPKFIQYVVFNLTFNFFMFKTFAQPLLSIIGQ
ncbi:MAG: hypothetical protein ABEJ36_03275 [Candidatus Nanosalina sp.]